MKMPRTVRRIPPIHEEPKAKCYSSKNFNKVKHVFCCPVAQST